MTTMSTLAPSTWGALGFARPKNPAPGALLKGNRRVLVRGFDTTKSGYEQLTDDADERFFVDSSWVNEPDELATTIKRGDIVLVVGEFAQSEEPRLFTPTLVAQVGPRAGDWVRVWAICDSDLVEQEQCQDLEIPRSKLQGGAWAIVTRLALTGEPASPSDRHELFSLFGVR
jgi:hypothetical protein